MSVMALGRSSLILMYLDLFGCLVILRVPGYLQALGPEVSQGTFWPDYKKSPFEMPLSIIDMALEP